LVSPITLSTNRTTGCNASCTHPHQQGSGSNLAAPTNWGRYTTEARKQVHPLEKTPPPQPPPDPADRGGDPVPEGAPRRSARPDQGRLQPLEGVPTKRPRPTKGPLPTTDPIPRHPEPTGLRPAHREEAALPVDEERDGSVLGCVSNGPSDRPRSVHDEASLCLTCSIVCRTASMRASGLVS
jgi:hypothetical protein